MNITVRRAITWRKGLAAFIALALVALIAIFGANLASAATPSASPSTSIDAGGPSVSGWLADGATSPSSDLVAGQTTYTASTTHAIDVSSSTIPDGTPASIFQTERWSPGSSLDYSVPATTATSTVRLFFAENYSGAQAVGARLMDVVINGITVDKNLDVYKLVGGYAGLVRTYTVASPGPIAINITNPDKTNSPHLMGLTVTPVGNTPVTTPPTSTVIDAGGPSVSGWLADGATSPSSDLVAGQTTYTASTTHAIDVSSSTIPDGTPASIFQTERWSPGSSLDYSVPATTATSTVRLFFAENYSGAQAVGARLMDVVINGITVDKNLDVYKLVGGYAGLVRTYTVASPGPIAINITNPDKTNSPHLMGLSVAPPDGGAGATLTPTTTTPPTTTAPTTAPPTTTSPVTTAPTVPPVTIPTDHVTISAGANVAAIVAAAPANTNFVLDNGTYFTGGIQPKDGDTLTGVSRAGVILDGNGTQANAFTGSGVGVTISDLTVQHYVPARLYAAIDGTQSTNWTFLDLHVTNNREEGIAVGPGSLVNGVLADHNGNVGIGTGTVNNDPHATPFPNLIFTVENSELSYNGQQDPADAAGAKVLFTNGATFNNNYVHNNYGFGLWTDAYNRNTIYENNTVQNNMAGGIFHEISFAAIIRNNVVSGNAVGYCTGTSYFCGTGGITISDSHDVEIYGNTLTGNHDEIVAYNGHASTVLLYDIQVHNNVMTDTVGTTGIQTFPYDAGAYATSHWYNNTYQPGQVFDWNGVMGLSGWTAAGQS